MQYAVRHVQSVQYTFERYGVTAYVDMCSVKLIRKWTVEEVTVEKRLYFVVETCSVFQPVKDSLGGPRGPTIHPDPLSSQRRERA